MALLLWPTLNGTPLAAGPIFTAISAQIPLTELGQASGATVVLPAADARAVAAMVPYTLLEIEQEGVGTIGYGYVLNPRQQITDRDEHTITLELAPLTAELTWRLTGPEWTAATWLTVVAKRLAALAPGWAADPSTVSGGPAGDFVVSVTLDNPTIWAGFLDTAQRFGQFARLGADATGAPARVLEMGQFGAAPAVTLASAEGADPEAIRGNAGVRLAATVDRQPNDVSRLVNVCVPFGGGADAALVTLERLWRIINDPTYPNYGRYGAAAGSVFPEYDPAYPIADPQTGTRGVTLGGHFTYPVHDAASYALYGRREGRFVDSSLVYADNTVANQELTARALYVSTVANFKRFAHPHHSFACTAPGTGRPTRAGDLISVAYRRVSAGDDGAVVEMDVQEDLRVMAVVRSFDGDAPPVDTYTLSNLGRFDADAAAGAGQADTARTLEALQMGRGTGLAKDSVVIRDNIDAANPITHWLYVATEHFRYHQVRVRCDFLPFRGTANTAYSDPNIPLELMPDVDVPHGDHTLAGAGVTDAGLTGTTDGFDLVQTGVDNDAVVKITINNDGGTLPIGQRLNAQLLTNQGSVGAAWRLSSGAVPDGTPLGANLKINFVKAKTKTPFTAAVNKAVSTAKTLVGKMPSHIHLIEQRIPTGQPQPASIALAIGGQGLSSGAAASGARNADGSFSSSFVVSDIGPYLDAFPPGTDVPLTFTAGTSASNPSGVGYLSITITAVEELGGNVSTVAAQ